jgi:hypothetical protein
MLSNICIVCWLIQFHIKQNVVLFDNILFVWDWEFHYYQSEHEDLEILVQQKNSFQRFIVSFIVLKLSFSYRTAINYICLYILKKRTLVLNKNCYLLNVNNVNLMCNNTWYIHVQCTLLFIFAVCTAWCLYLQCMLLYAGKYHIQ